MTQSLNRYFKCCIAVAVLFIHFNGHAQKVTNSPYSSFGMGEIDYSTMAYSASMGSTGTAFIDSNLINLHNPASWSFLGQKRPLLNADFKGSFATLMTENNEGRANSFIFQNIVLGIPIKKNWGLAFGLTPFSKIGYDATTYNDELLEDTIRYNYDGNGGSNRVFLSLSYRPLNLRKHKLSLGATVGYLFGSAERVREVVYPDEYNYFNSRYEESLRFRDFTFDFGVLYQYHINDRVISSVGLNYTPQRSIKTYNDIFSYNYAYSNGEEVIFDTVIYQDTVSGSITYPQRINGGISFVFKGNPKKPSISRTTVNLDMVFQEWSKYEETFENAKPYTNSMRNSMSYRLGVEFIPNDGSKYDANASYFELISYRAGLRYENTRLTLNNTDINNFGISFGLGLPMRIGGAVSSINLGAEWGQRGTTRNGLIKEDYWKVYVGLSLSPGRYDRWFIKRKYD